jgi:hypothetical protein
LSHKIELRNSTGGSWPSSHESLAPPIHLSNLYHLELDIKPVDYLFKHFQFPKLRSLRFHYGGEESSRQIECLNFVSLQLEKLELVHAAPAGSTIRRFTILLRNLVELTIERAPSPNSPSHLFSAPRLKILRIYPRRSYQEHDPVHCLGYILGNKGMLEPVHTLTRLHLRETILADESRPEYCTRHLRVHRHLEFLTFVECQLPEDFLGLMHKPLDASNEFLPYLKEIRFENCMNIPSGDWFEDLAISRPLLACRVA